jgi:hypothetical protein
MGEVGKAALRCYADVGKQFENFSAADAASFVCEVYEHASHSYMPNCKSLQVELLRESLGEHAGDVPALGEVLRQLEILSAHVSSGAL